MERLWQTAGQREQIQEWLKQDLTLADMAAKYAISTASLATMRRNVDNEFSKTMKRRVWLAITQWRREKSGQPVLVQAELPGMPPTRRSILQELIQKELDAAGDDKLERFYKAIITA